MKVLAENLKDIEIPLESVTINLSPEELDYITTCLGACVQPKGPIASLRLFTEFNDIRRKFMKPKYVYVNSLELKYVP